MTKPAKLITLLSCVFISSILIAEVVGVKLFSLEKSLGFEPFQINLFGETNLSLTLSVGVLPWPIIFILTDLINDYFGYTAVRFLSFLSAGIIGLMFLFFYFSIHTFPETNWWLGSYANEGVPNMQMAYAAVLGQGMNIIVGSIVAFIIGQLVDGIIFKKIKQKMGSKKIWIRAVASTLVSQFLDSFIVIFVAFYLFRNMNFSSVVALCIVSYSYKFLIAILSSPLINFGNFLIENFLGKEQAEMMKQSALIDK